MDSKCLRLLRICSSTIFIGGLLLYRIGAGCCSIIVRRALLEPLSYNRQHARAIFMPVHNHSWGLFSPFVKLVVGFLDPIYKQLI